MAAPVQMEMEDEMLLNQFRMPINKQSLGNVMYLMRQQIQWGLSRQEAPVSDLLMEPAFIREEDICQKSFGKFLTIDFRSRYVTIHYTEIIPNEEPVLLKTAYTIEDKVLQGNGQGLLNDFVEKTIRFIEECHNPPEAQAILPLTLIFGFPCKHTEIQNAILIRWTKEFEWVDLEGHNFAELLESTFAMRNLDYVVRRVCVCNDTVANLVAASYSHDNIMMSVIIADGTNCAYIESMNNMPQLIDEQTDQHHKMIVNTEWGDFGSNGTLSNLRTLYDMDLDSTKSLITGRYLVVTRQMFEKMVGARYLHELLVMVMQHCIHHGHIKAKQSGYAELSPDTIEEIYLPPSQLGSERTAEVPEEAEPYVRQFLKSCGAPEASLREVKLVYNIADVIYRRAAYFAAAAVAAVLNYVHTEGMVVSRHSILHSLENATQPIGVAMDGSLWLTHEHFKAHFVYQLGILVDKRVPYQLHTVNADEYGVVGAMTSHAALKADLRRVARETLRQESMVMK